MKKTVASKNPIETLRKEHELVLKTLDKLEASAEKENLNSLNKNLIFLESEFNRHSLKKEEKVLFPEIEKFIPREGGPTGVMIMEHKDLVKSMANLSESIKNNDIENVKRMVSHIVNLLRQHIAKENDILFMIAEMHFNDKQKKVIMEKFKKIDLKKHV